MSPSTQTGRLLLHVMKMNVTREGDMKMRKARSKQRRKSPKRANNKQQKRRLAADEQAETSCTTTMQKKRTAARHGDIFNFRLRQQFYLFRVSLS